MKNYLRENRGLLLLNLVLLVGLAALTAIIGVDGVRALMSPDVAAGLMMAEAGAVELKAMEKAMKDAFEAMGAKLRETQDQLVKGLEESKKYGDTIESKTNENLEKLGGEMRELATQYKATRDEVLALAQKMATVPQGGSGDAQKGLYELIAESEEYKRAGRDGRMAEVKIGSFHRHAKTQIVNASGQNQPLVADVRVPGIITPAEQRLTIRDLIPQTSFDGNLVQYTSEATFTSNARPQGDVSPVGNGEGEQFAESAMTFTLANAPVVTIGHWIPASKQVLSDAALLQGHISGRLTYGLKLKEEQDLLTATGGAGTVNGINNQATAFTGGVTNATILDTLLRALLQVSLSNYEASGFILHPVDWYNAMLLKDSNNRYLFSDPQSMVAPRVWAKPVVPTQSQTLGKFTAGAFDLACQIWDREDATVRISENVNDHFIRNMVAILAEERLAFVVYRTTALVYGNTSNAG